MTVCIYSSRAASARGSRRGAPPRSAGACSAPRRWGPPVGYTILQ